MKLQEKDAARAFPASVLHPRVGRAAANRRGVCRAGGQRRAGRQRRRARGRVVGDGRRDERVGRIAQLDRGRIHRRRIHRLAEGGRDGRVRRHAGRPLRRRVAGDRRRRRVARRASRGGEHHVDPVVRRVEGLRRESARRAIAVDAVPAAGAAREQVDRAVVHACAREEAVVARVVAVRREVRGDVDRAGGDGNRRREVHLLPSRGRLAAEGRGREASPPGGPEAADMGPGVAGALVEPDAGDEAVDVDAELDAELHRIGIRHLWIVRNRGTRPRRARAIRSRVARTPW